MLSLKEKGRFGKEWPRELVMISIYIIRERERQKNDDYLLPGARLMVS